MNHIDETIATYDSIAKDYGVIATPENRAWLKDSMRIFAGHIQGKEILVAGCGEGRDSRYLTGLGFRTTSFDLSDGMLNIARNEDPDGIYLKRDLREISKIGSFDGIWACACLYHLNKEEFLQCIEDIWNSLNPQGVFFCNLKLGDGAQFIAKPRKGYPGGAKAQEKLAGRRFYTFYELPELAEIFRSFELLEKRKDILKEGKGAMEFWLRKP